MAHLVDSSIFISLFLDFDANHAEAARLMDALNGTFYVTSGAVGEVATVLTYKHSKKQADLFFEYLAQSDHMTILDEELDDEIIFFTAIPQRISFIDSTILMRAQRMNLPLVTFDRQLKQIAKKMNIKVV